MPNRYVREGILVSDAVNALSPRAELFYRRLLNIVDDFGRYSALPRLLLPMVFPLQVKKIGEEEIAEWLKECYDKQVLIPYGEGIYLVVVKWEQGRAKASKFPQPPPDVCKRQQMKTYANTRKHASAHVPDSDSDSDSESPIHTYGRPANKKAVIDQGVFIGLPADECEAFYDHFAAPGWIDKNSNPIVDWKARLSSWKRDWEARKHKERTKHANSRTSNSRSNEIDRTGLNEKPVIPIVTFGKHRADGDAASGDSEATP